MKSNLYIIITAIIFSCSQSEVKPKCYLIQWEKTVTYDNSLEVWSDKPDLPEITRGQEITCKITKKELDQLLEIGNTTTKGIGICITVHTIASETTEASPNLSITILSNQVYDLTFTRENKFYWAETWDKSHTNEIRINNFEIGTYKLNITDGINSKDTTFHYPSISKLTLEMP